MSPRTRTLLVTVVFALLVATAGCADSGNTAPADAPSPDELQEKATAAMQDVTTASFTMDMNMETSQGSVAIQANGRMDTEARRMYMDMSMDMGSRSIDLVQYIIDETAYQQVQGQWQTSSVSGQDIWEQGNQLALQRQMLENSTIEFAGSDTVDGNDVWIVSVRPSEDAIQQLLGQTGAGVGENVDVNDLSFEQYIDTDSYHVRKISMEMDTTVQGEDARLNLTMTFSDFGEPVDIQLPEEATG